MENAVEKATLPDAVCYDGGITFRPTIVSTILWYRWRGSSTEELPPNIIVSLEYQPFVLYYIIIFVVLYTNGWWDFLHRICLSVHFFSKLFSFLEGQV